MAYKSFGFGLSDTRYTSRYQTDMYEYPEFVLEIRDAVRKAVGVQDAPYISDHGKDGVVFNYTLPSGDLHRHKDPRSLHGELALRCNVLSSAADSGGVLHVNDVPIEVNVGDLHCYFASEHWHHVTKVEGQSPRVLWMFGAYVKENEFKVDET
jgi:hypothetical protein